jgi:heme exporter protein A
MEFMLTVENISCERGGKNLFHNLSFTVGDACVLVVRGENGSGKTTLLETIACLRSAGEGKILYANKNVNGEHYQEYCDIIHYVGHRQAIKPQLTVKENIEFWASLRGNLAAVPAAITFFGIDDYAQVLCGELSAGYKKRVALARLMVTNSQIWLLDEPFVNLDSAGAEALANLVATRVERGGSVIITAHGDLPFKNYAEINLRDWGVGV